jgi:hypothetical protein
MELKAIQEAAKETVDEQGNPVVQIPLDLWDAFLAEQQGGQIARINAVIASWDEFMAFLADNRFKLSWKE